MTLNQDIDDETDEDEDEPIIVSSKCQKTSHNLGIFILFFLITNKRVEES